MKSIFYERLFLLNRCLEQAGEILMQFQQEGLIRPDFARQRRQAVEDLRFDLSYFVTGLLHRRELEECVGLAEKLAEPQQKSKT